jgi:hypothetical protein
LTGTRSHCDRPRLCAAAPLQYVSLSNSLSASSPLHKELASTFHDDANNTLGLAVGNPAIKLKVARHLRNQSSLTSGPFS